MDDSIPVAKKRKINRRQKIAKKLSDPSSKLYKAMNKETIGIALSCSCICIINCLFHCSLEQVTDGRMLYHSMDEVEKMNWLLEKLKTFYDQDSASFCLMLNGKRVCWRAFSGFYGITHYKWYRARMLVMKGVDIIQHGNSFREYKTQKNNRICSWLGNYKHMYADKMPHCNEYCNILNKSKFLFVKKVNIET